MSAESWSFHHPTKIFSGTECLEQLTRLGAHNDGKVLLITTKGALQRGYLKEIIDHIQDGNVYVWDKVQPNPDLDGLDRIIKELQKFKASSIIALGGGSVLDTGKTLSVMLPCLEDTPLHKLFRNQEQLHFEKKIKLTAIPTTSGSGAEVTPFATIWDSSVYKKYSLNHPFLCPEYVLLKPELCTSLPFNQTLYSGLDLISHALESLWNINSNPITQGFASQALNLANKSFSTVLAKPDDIAGRKDMLHAALLAGLAISQTKTAIAHSISYPLTARFNIPHGLACAFTLPALLKMNKKILNDILSSGLLKKTNVLLNSMQLSSNIVMYAEKSSILSLVEEMLSPERAKNYIRKLNHKDVLDLLKQSIC